MDGLAVETSAPKYTIAIAIVETSLHRCCPSILDRGRPPPQHHPPIHRKIGGESGKDKDTDWQRRGEHGRNGDMAY